MLTLEQEVFLKAHNINITDVLDAKWLKRSDYQREMKKTNKIIAYNVAPCQKWWHTMRTRAWHCCQCDTSRIAYQKRNDSRWIVYIASSKIWWIIKIWVTHEIQNRQGSLNRTKYAWLSDWIILMALYCDEAWGVEHKIHSSLSEKKVCLKYLSWWRLQDSHEVFECSFDYAKHVLQSVLKENNYEASMVSLV